MSILSIDSIGRMLQAAGSLSQQGLKELRRWHQSKVKAGVDANVELTDQDRHALVALFARRNKRMRNEGFFAKVRAWFTRKGERHYQPHAASQTVGDRIFLTLAAGLYHHLSGAQKNVVMQQWVAPEHYFAMRGQWYDGRKIQRSALMSDASFSELAAGKDLLLSDHDKAYQYAKLERLAKSNPTQLLAALEGVSDADFNRWVKYQPKLHNIMLEVYQKLGKDHVPAWFVIQMFGANNEVDPISQESFEDIAPENIFISESGHFFDVTTLANYLVQAVELIHPLTNQLFSDNDLKKLVTYPDTRRAISSVMMDYYSQSYEREQLITRATLNKVEATAMALHNDRNRGNLRALDGVVEGWSQYVGELPSYQRDLLCRYRLTGENDSSQVYRNAERPQLKKFTTVGALLEDVTNTCIHQIGGMLMSLVYEYRASKERSYSASRYQALANMITQPQAMVSTLTAAIDSLKPADENVKSIDWRSYQLACGNEDIISFKKFLGVSEVQDVLVSELPAYRKLTPELLRSLRIASDPNSPIVLGLDEVERLREHPLTRGPSDWRLLRDSDLNLDLLNQVFNLCRMQERPLVDFLASQDLTQAQLVTLAKLHPAYLSVTHLRQLFSASAFRLNDEHIKILNNHVELRREASGCSLVMDGVQAIIAAEREAARLAAERAEAARLAAERAMQIAAAARTRALQGLYSLLPNNVAPPRALALTVKVTEAAKLEPAVARPARDIKTLDLKEVRRLVAQLNANPQAQCRALGYDYAALLATAEHKMRKHRAASGALAFFKNSRAKAEAWGDLCTRLKAPEPTAVI